MKKMENKKRLIDADAFGCFLLGKMGFNPVSAEMVLQWMDEYIKKNTIDAVEVVHGRWVKQVENGMYWYVCSECGEEVPKTRYKHDFFSDYCPNCGAKMDGDGNG